MVRQCWSGLSSKDSPTTLGAYLFSTGGQIHQVSRPAGGTQPKVGLDPPAALAPAGPARWWLRLWRGQEPSPTIAGRARGPLGARNRRRVLPQLPGVAAAPRAQALRDSALAPRGSSSHRKGPSCLRMPPPLPFLLPGPLRCPWVRASEASAPTRWERERER